MEILAGLKGKISKEEIRKAIQRAGLDPDLKKSVSKYSLGMRQRLGIAQAIMENPEFLILDEPFNGLDKHGVADIRALILSLKEQGKTIIVSTHIFSLIEKICDRVGIIIDGSMAVCDTLDKIRDGKSLEDRFFDIYAERAGERYEK